METTSNFITSFRFLIKFFPYAYIFLVACLMYRTNFNMEHINEEYGFTHLQVNIDEQNERICTLNVHEQSFMLALIPLSSSLMEPQGNGSHFSFAELGQHV